MHAAASVAQSADIFARADRRDVATALGIRARIHARTATRIPIPRAAQCDPTPPQRRADTSLPGCLDFPQTAVRRGAPAIPPAGFDAFATGFVPPADHEKSVMPTEFQFLDTPFQM
ncbi:hypothetical protein [Burkholderia sp. Bp9099]|uniref:hypothetical protein n=1 Tax=Burkholderia sp. Bp9099 TaxID=2184568 RepID=UPI000F5DA968|nr:hypothetical protein [Burkholderia sp. Bp9099]